MPINRFLQFNRASVFLGDLLRECKAETDATLFAFADKWQNMVWRIDSDYAWAVICNLDANATVVLSQVELDEWKVFPRRAAWQALSRRL